MQYRNLPCSWHHCTDNSTSSDAIPLLPLRLASLYLQQHKLCCNAVSSLAVGVTVLTTAIALMHYRYFPCIWHHCTYNSTTSDAIPLLPLQLASLYIQQHQLWCNTVTSLAVGITVITTELALMQYRYFPYSWHHFTYNSTSSDAITLLPLQLASPYLQQH